MLLKAQDILGYRVLLNLQPVLLRGFVEQPQYDIVPAEPHLNSSDAPHVAAFLFQNGFQTIHDRDSCGWTPLHYAALRGEPALIQELLKQQADLHCTATR